MTKRHQKPFSRDPDEMMKSPRIGDTIKAPTILEITGIRADGHVEVTARRPAQHVLLTPANWRAHLREAQLFAEERKETAERTIEDVAHDPKTGDAIEITRAREVVRVGPNGQVRTKDQFGQSHTTTRAMWANVCMDKAAKLKKPESKAPARNSVEIRTLSPDNIPGSFEEWEEQCLVGPRLDSETRSLLRVAWSAGRCSGASEKVDLKAPVDLDELIDQMAAAWKEGVAEGELRRKKEIEKRLFEDPTSVPVTVRNHPKVGHRIVSGGCLYTVQRTGFDSIRVHAAHGNHSTFRKLTGSQWKELCRVGRRYP